LPREYIKAWPEGWVLDLVDGSVTAGTLLSADAITFCFHFPINLFVLGPTGKFQVSQSKYSIPRTSFSKTVTDPEAFVRILDSFEDGAEAVLSLKTPAIPPMGGGGGGGGGNGVGGGAGGGGGGGGGDDDDDDTNQQCPIPASVWEELSSDLNPHKIFFWCKKQFKTLMPNER
jgi:hypothetical protein